MLQLSRNRSLHDVHGGVRPPIGGPRLTIGTDGHYRYGGSPIILRGFCFGAETYYRPGDCAIAQAMGANCIRFTTRAWAPPPGGDFKGDAYDPTSPISGFLNIAYFNRICAGVMEAKSLGMVTRLSFDSDCGQAERPGVPNCEINGAPSTFWLPSGAQRLQNHLNAIKTYTRTLRGYLDQIEPFIEPHPDVTWPYGQGLIYDDRDVCLMQERGMQAALGEDDKMTFLIGGLSYFRNKLGFPSKIFLPDWITRRNCAATGNLLDGAVADTYDAVAASVKQFTDFRAGYEVPVDSQQLGVRDDSDPGYTYQAQMYGLLSNPPGGGGSISYTQWEFVSAPGQNYAPFQQDHMNDTGPRTVDQARVDAMTAGFALPRLYS
jgi:hypothetical protein